MLHHTLPETNRSHLKNLNRVRRRYFSFCDGVTWVLLLFVSRRSLFAWRWHLGSISHDNTLESEIMTNGRELKVVNLPRISTFGTWSYCHCKHVAADGRCYRGCQQRVKGQCLRRSPILSPVARKCKSISPIFTPQNYAGTYYKIFMPWWMQ